MINGWTEDEICMLYRDAKHKKQQIEILTQLTGLRRSEIENILQERGYIELDDKKKEEILKYYYNDGLSDSAIARKTSTAQSQVSKFLRSKGLPPNGIKIQKKNEIKEEAKMSEEKNVPEIEPETKSEDVNSASMTKQMNIPDGNGNKERYPDASAKVSGSEIKQGVIEDLKKETQENLKELKSVLPESIPDPDSLPINYDIVETLTPQQYYEMAKMTIQSINSVIELMRTIWEG